MKVETSQIDASLFEENPLKLDNVVSNKEPTVVKKKLKPLAQISKKKAFRSSTIPGSIK